MIICCGEALIDMVRVPVPGLGEGFLPLAGGSPYNTAIAIGKLGVPVKFLGRFSKDFFGEILVKRLKDNHVSEDLLIRGSQNSTLAFVKLEKAKEPQYVFYTEGAADRSFSTADLPSKLPEDTRCILFGSISMTMEPIASAIEALILREGTRKSADQMDGAPIISFDPNIRPFMIKDKGVYIERFEKWVAAATIAKISSADFEFIYPKLSLDQALQKTLAMGPRLVLSTMGAKGAVALLRRNDGSVIRVSVPGIEVQVADTIGAGDTFHGAFLAWLEMKGKMSRSALAGLSENDLHNALFFANKAASIVCSRQGAEPPTRREIESLKILLPKPETRAKTAAKKGAAKKKPNTGKAAGRSGKVPASKAAIKPKTKNSGKPKPAAKPVSKVAAKTVSKAAAKPVSKTKAKPAAKPSGKGGKKK